MRPTIQWTGLAVLLLLGFLIQYGMQFRETVYEFDFQVIAGESSYGWRAAVLHPSQRHPVVIYAHAAGECLTNDQPILLELAELGLAAVSLDYDQTNHAHFPGELQGLQSCLSLEPWADTNAVAWMGMSLGANHFIDETLRHSGPQPQLLMLLSSQGIAPRAAPVVPADFHGTVLLGQGRDDDLFPWTQAEQLYLTLTNAGVPAVIKVFPGLDHGLEPDRDLIVRSLGEYCLTRLAGTNWWRSYHPPEAPAAGWSWLPWLPAIAWAGLVGWQRRKQRRREPVSPADSLAPATRISPALRAISAILAAGILAVYFVYVIMPRLPANTITTALARRCIVTAAEQADFDYLVSRPEWNGRPLQAAFNEIVRAGYAQRRFNLRGDNTVYREFCLSPFITGATDETIGWRPALAAEFGPCTGAERDPAAAAARVVRHLRESVCVLNDSGLPHDASAIWRRRVTDPAGFEIICVAALRSVGIPARLDANRHAELWTGSAWQPAPAPAVMAWQ